MQTGVNPRRPAGSRRDRRVRGTGRGAEFPRARYREVQTLAGDETVESTGLPPGLVQLIVQ